MTQWRLFDEGNPPQVADPVFLAGQPWMRLTGQPGFSERAEMVCNLVESLLDDGYNFTSVCDLGCGDGSMLSMLAGRGIDCPMWGYDLGDMDLAYGRSRGLDLRKANVVSDQLDYGTGGLVLCTEVLEHLVDPVSFLKGIGSDMLVATSPRDETLLWHNDIHLWAWDEQGYKNLMRWGGWTVDRHDVVDGGWNNFGGVVDQQRFQGVTAIRA